MMPISFKRHRFLPEDMRAAVGVENGGSLLAHLRDGVIMLEPVDAAVMRA